MPRPLQPVDLLSLQSVGDIALHPDGELVAFTITQMDYESDSYRSQIHFHGASKSDGGSSQVSYGHHDSTLRFSPSGKLLAFVRNTPKEHAQVQILDVSSRSLFSLSNRAGLSEEGISDIQWLDEDHLAVLAPQRCEADVDVDNDELGRRPRVLTGVGGLNEGAGWTTDRLKTIEVVSIATGERRQLSPPDQAGGAADCNSAALDYHSIAVSPDGSQVLALASRGEDPNLAGHQEIHLLASDGIAATIVAAGRYWDSPGWLHDGSAIATSPKLDNALQLGRLVRLNVDISDPDLVASNQAATRLSDDGITLYQPGSASGGRWSTDSSLFCLANRRGSVTLDQLDIETGMLTTLIGGDQVVTNFDSNSTGTRMIAAITSPNRPAELWELTDGKLQRLVELNQDLLAELDLAPVEIVQVPSSDGAVVEAFIFRPPASVPSTGAARPGLVYIHGGPTGAYGHSFFDEFQIAAAAGYVVIAGNPRGSDGYGDEWAEVLQGKIGTVDYDDIMALSDHLESLPEVDSKRIGVGGGSYGGLMTAWMIGHTHRYQAALVERCVSNIESFAGTSDIGGYFPQMLNGTTVETDHVELRRQSPLSYAPNVQTPVLIIHSDSDYRCPLEQGQQLFSAYRRNGVDATMVIFPGENHELSRSGKPKHRMERFAYIHDFYAKHLGGGTVQTAPKSDGE